MTWNRRRFLVSSATICGGAAFTGAYGAPLLTGLARDRVRLLISEDEVRSAAFNRGVRAALGGVEVETLTMPVRLDLARWRVLAENIRGGVVLGVVNTSEFVLVNELMRETGARLLYLVEHVFDAAGAARHTLTTSTDNVDVSTSLLLSSGAWPEALGIALARVVMHQRLPGAMITETIASYCGTSGHSSCASFVFVA